METTFGRAQYVDGYEVLIQYDNVTDGTMAENTTWFFWWKSESQLIQDWGLIMSS